MNEAAYRAAASSKVQKLIRRLKQIQGEWPTEEKVWLFCTGNSIYLMATHPDGSRHDHNAAGVSPGMDPDLEIASFRIPHDGGDW